MQRRRFLVIIVVISLSSPAVAAPIEYGDYFGLGFGDPDFLSVREDSATDKAPLFGAPIHEPYRLIFEPDSFFSTSENGVADTTSGTISTRIRAAEGQFLEYVLVKEEGEYALSTSGPASPQTSATVNGLMTLVDIDPAINGLKTATLDVSPLAPYALPNNQAGEFTATLLIDLTGLEISQVIINMNNSLQTTSESGTSATIQKKKVVIEVPEPGVAALLMVGGLICFRRRSRRF